VIPGGDAGQLVRPLTAAMKMANNTRTRESVDLPESMSGIAKLEVITPTSQLPIQLLNQYGCGFEAHPAAGHLAESLTLSRQRFFRRNHIHIEKRPSMQVRIFTERETQKIHAS